MFKHFVKLHPRLVCKQSFTKYISNHAKLRLGKNACVRTSTVHAALTLPHQHGGITVRSQVLLTTRQSRH